MDAEEKARIAGCIQRGVALFGKDFSNSTLGFIQERSGMTLQKLIESPKGLILALRHLFGPQSLLVFKSIRFELLLSAIGHYPRNGRVEAFLFALTKAKESMSADMA